MPIRPKSVVIAWVDAFDRQDVEALAAFYTEDAVNHQVAEAPVAGRGAIRTMFAAGFAAARNTMTYDRPIAGAFTTTATHTQPEDWPRFLRMLRRMGRARIAVQASLHIEGETAGRFEGQFVALGVAEETSEGRVSGD